MKQRYITALILIPLFLGLLLFCHRHVLGGLIFLVAALAADEYLRMQAARELKASRVVSVAGIAVIITGASLGGSAGLGAGFFCALLLLALTELFRPGDMTEKMIRLPAAAFGAILAFLLAHFILLRTIDPDVKSLGIGLIVFLLAVVWLSDTCAYHVGKAFGRHKLAPVISPKKTIEGLAGALAGGVLIAFIADLITGLHLPALHLLLLGLLLPALGHLGDLIESIFKRGAGMKDSSALIPGHGGMFDRVDSMLFTIPVLYYYARFFMNLP